MSLLPAWSAAFEEGSLSAVRGLPLPDARDWAFGGSTGAGVTVAVDRQRGRRRPSPGRPGEWGGRAGDRRRPAGGLPRRRGAARRPGRPRHRLRGDHPVARAGGGDLQRAGPRGEPQGSRRAVPRRHLLGHRPRDGGGQPLAVQQERGDVRPLHQVADEAYFKRTLLVSAANNQPGPTYPSQYASVVSVAARPATTRWRWPTTPSLRWSSAHGGSTSTSPGGRRVDGRHRQQLRGTARLGDGGVAAGKHPELAPFQVKAVLQAVSDNVRPRMKPTLRCVSGRTVAARRQVHS